MLSCQDYLELKIVSSLVSHSARNNEQRKRNCKAKL